MSERGRVFLGVGVFFLHLYTLMCYSLHHIPIILSSLAADMKEAVQTSHMEVIFQSHRRKINKIM